MNPNQSRRPIILLLVAASVALFALHWLYTHSFIEINAAASADGEISYTLLEQGSQKTTTIRSSSKTVKKLVKRGNYEVHVQKGESSHFSVNKTEGFLGSTRVEAKLKPEKTRQFVGNNPRPCMYYSGDLLFSYSCGGSFEDIQVHVPATGSTPTFTQKSHDHIEGSLEGVVHINGATIALFQELKIEPTEGAPHALYRIDNSLNLSNGKPLPELSKDKTYAIDKHREGFIIYSTDFSEFFYSTSFDASLQKINIGKPGNDELKPYLLSTQGNNLVAAYSNNTEGEVADIHDTNNQAVVTEMVIYADGDTRHIGIKGQYLAAEVCGSEKLCMLNGNQLEIYSIANNKPTLLYKVSSVSTIETVGTTLLVVNDKGVIELDVDGQSGFMHYSFGEYQYCALEDSETDYLLCLINNRNEKVALRINPNQDIADNIDKKVLELSKLSEIKDLSMYKEFIFISLNAGDLAYDSRTNGYSYAQDVLQTKNNKINEAISMLGIDRSKYKIINTLQ